MVNDTITYDSISNPGSSGVRLLRWVCPKCGMVVDTEITQKDFDRLTIDELKNIMNSLTVDRMNKAHKCKMVPIQFVERGIRYDGLYTYKRGKGSSRT